jgi:hypothetical protein
MILLKRCAIPHKCICVITLGALLLGLFDVVWAASASQGQQTKFGKGRILDYEDNKIYFSWIDIAEPLFVYQHRGSSSESTIPAEKVWSIEVQRGSYALNGLMWGSLGSLGLILIVGAIAEERGGWEIDWGSVPPYVAGGALIGMFAGLSKPKYATIYGFHRSDLDDFLENRSHGELDAEGLILFRFAYSF